MNVEAVLAGRQAAQIRGEAGAIGSVLDQNGTEPHARVGRVNVHRQRRHFRRGGRRSVAASDLVDPLRELPVEAIDEEPRQHGDVLRAVAQRRKLHAQYVQPKEEIFAERAVAHAAFEAPVGCCDHPDVNVDIPGAADPLEGLLVQKPQELRLQRRRHLPDFVQKHRAAVRRLEQPAPLSPRIREGSLFVAEELAFEQGLRQRRAGDVHEGPTGPIARVVDHLGGEVLAGAASTWEPNRARASAPDSASMTPYPSDERRSTRDQRISRSSSTTRMVALGICYGIIAPLSTKRAAQPPVA